MKIFDKTTERKDETLPAELMLQNVFHTMGLPMPSMGNKEQMLDVIMRDKENIEKQVAERRAQAAGSPCELDRINDAAKMLNEIIATRETTSPRP